MDKHMADTSNRIVELYRFLLPMGFLSGDANSRFQKQTTISPAACQSNSVQ